MQAGQVDIVWPGLPTLTRPFVSGDADAIRSDYGIDPDAVTTSSWLTHVGTNSSP
jgi:hypothetical protein